MEVVQHEGADQQSPPGPGLRGEQQQQQRHKESRHLLQEPAEPGRAAARLRGRVAAVLCAVLHLPQQVSAPTHHQTPVQVRHDGLAALHHTRQQPRGGEEEEMGEEEKEEGATRDLLASRVPAQPVSKEKRNRGAWCLCLHLYFSECGILFTSNLTLCRRRNVLFCLHSLSPEGAVQRVLPLGFLELLSIWQYLRISAQQVNSEQQLRFITSALCDVFHVVM